MDVFKLKTPFHGSRYSATLAKESYCIKTNDRLAKIVNSGKLRFIIIHGALGWGVLTATVVTAFKFFTHQKTHFPEVLISFIVFPICGLLWGAFMWPILKKKHEANLAGLSNENPEPNRVTGGN